MTTDREHDPLGRSELDRSLDGLKQVYSRGQPDASLQGRIVAAASETLQRPRTRFILNPWGRNWSWSVHGSAVVGLASAGVLVLVLIALVGMNLLESGPVGGTPGAAGTSPATPAATDAAASQPAHVPGTCPVTPITRIAGG
ncbi:MAG: hypothetical protein ACRDGI_06385, partial [Candidatus Limnocylindrales bacterium]